MGLIHVQMCESETERRIHFQLPDEIFLMEISFSSVSLINNPKCYLGPALPIYCYPYVNVQTQSDRVHPQY